MGDLKQKTRCFMITNLIKSKKFNEIFFVVLGSFLYCVGVKWFVVANGLVVGGVTGLSVLLDITFRQFFGLQFSVGVINLVLSVPIFVFSFFVNGFKFVRKSIFAMILNSFWLTVLNSAPSFLSLNGDLICAAICGGVFCGVGSGLILKFGASTGGVDMFANALNKLVPQIPIPIILFSADFFVISSGFIFFKFYNIVISVVMSYIISKIINNLLVSLRFARAVFIFSKETDKISDEIFSILKRGNTQINCKGMYSKQLKQMLMVVVKPNEILKLKKAIEKIDSKAFVVICSVQEVLGNWV